MHTYLVSVAVHHRQSQNNHSIITDRLRVTVSTSINNTHTSSYHTSKATVMLTSKFLTNVKTFNGQNLSTFHIIRRLPHTLCVFTLLCGLYGVLWPIKTSPVLCVNRNQIKSICLLVKPSPMIFQFLLLVLFVCIILSERHVKNEGFLEQKS